jgi:replicative DNA helicase
VAQFLRVLWETDGSVTTSRTGPRVRVCFGSSSRRLVEGVQQLLLRFGIQSRVGTGPHRVRRRGWVLRIDAVEHQRRFLSTIGVRGASPEHVIAALPLTAGAGAISDVDTIPFAVRPRIRSALVNAGLTHRGLAAAIGEQCIRRSGSGSVGRPRESSRERLAAIAELTDDKSLADLATSDVLWDRVVSIEPLGELEVFDATVLGTHNFVADGIVAHNSLEQDADVVMFLYRDEVYNKESSERGAADVIVAKHRAGPIGDMRLVFRGQYARFDNAAPRGVGP